MDFWSAFLKNISENLQQFSKIYGDLLLREYERKRVMKIG